jgi:hypothetical protein
MTGLIMRPPLLGPTYELHNIPTLPWKSPPSNPVKVGVNRLQIGVGITHDGLPEIVDAMADVAGLREVYRFGSIYGRIVPMTDGILC